LRQILGNFGRTRFGLEQVGINTWLGLLTEEVWAKQKGFYWAGTKGRKRKPQGRKALTGGGRGL